MTEYGYMLTDARYPMTARVCACVGMFGGVSSAGVSVVLACHLRTAQESLRSMVRSGCIVTSRVRGMVVYHLAKGGRRFIEAERARVSGEALAPISRARGLGEAFGWVRFDDLEQMETAIRSGKV